MKTTQKVRCELYVGGNKFSFEIEGDAREFAISMKQGDGVPLVSQTTKSGQPVGVPVREAVRPPTATLYEVIGLRREDDEHGIIKLRSGDFETKLAAVLGAVRGLKIGQRCFVELGVIEEVDLGTDSRVPVKPEPQS